MAARVLGPVHVPAVVVLILVFVLEAVLAPAATLASTPGPASPTIASDAIPSAEPEVETVPAAEERVEVVDDRTLDSRTFQNADGIFATEYSAAPIHYDPGDGTRAAHDDHAGRWRPEHDDRAALRRWPHQRRVHPHLRSQRLQHPAAQPLLRDR